MCFLPRERLLSLDDALDAAVGGLKIMCPAAVVIAMLLQVRLVLGLEIVCLFAGRDADVDSSRRASILCTGMRGRTRSASFSDVAAAAAAEKAF